MKILIVEDEIRLAQAIQASLEQEHYQVDLVHEGKQGAELAASGRYDLIILDIMLPGMDGFSILEEIRAYSPDTKVIMLTAREELDSRLKGLRGGASDYITKPFHMEELKARVDIQLHGVSAKQNRVIKAGDLQLDLKTGDLLCLENGKSILLKGKEYELAEYILNQPAGQVLSREQLYTKVWGWDHDLESNNLEAYLSFLRKKLKLLGSGWTIKAVRSMGYRLEKVKP